MKTMIACLFLIACSSPDQSALDATRPGWEPTLTVDLSNQDPVFLSGTATAVSALQRALTLPAGSTVYRVMMGIPTVRDTFVQQSTPQIVVRNMTSNACTWTVYGNSFGTMTMNVDISFNNAGDAFDSPTSTNETVMWCLEAGSWHFYYFSPPLSAVTGIGAVRVWGGTGADWIGCSSGLGSNSFACFGSGGNDYMETRGAVGAVTLHGEDGNDRVSSTTPAGAPIFLYGDAGDDCLQASSPPSPSWKYDCGIGTDRSTGVLGSGCETLTATCP